MWINNMGRKSTKENKNVYFAKRSELDLSRAEAYELFDSQISEDRLERIEEGKTTAYPEEVCIMAEKYKMPELCNYYCTNECEIGKKYVPQVTIKDISQIVLEMLNSLRLVNEKKDRLIEMTADGKIDETELEDFAKIRMDLDHISMTAEALRLWSEQMIASGTIDKSEASSGSVGRNESLIWQQGRDI